MTTSNSDACKIKHDVEFFGTVEGVYPNIPYSGDRPSKSIYIDLPNTYYDPIQGQNVLENTLDVLVSMEKYGLDGVAFTEQHNGPINPFPSGMVAAAYIAARTSRLKIVASGPLLNAYQSPIRLAEEIALVSQMSHGRLIVGLPMGLGQQYHSLGMNPATARERHKEGHDLLAKALSEPGPFTWRGKFFNQNYVNVWPRLDHKVDFLLPSGGSLETLELAAQRRYTYQTVLNHRPLMKATMDKFRELCRKEGYEPDPKQSACVIQVHVAETDEIARKEVEAEYLWDYQNYFETSAVETFPPGYTSLNSMKAILSNGYGLDTKKMTLQDLIDNNWVVVGSPQTVIEKLEETILETGCGRVLLNFSTGIKKRWLLDKCLTIFSQEVLPHFRKNGKPLDERTSPQGFDTTMEYAVKRRKDVPSPAIVRDGYLIDIWKNAIPGEDPVIRKWEETNTTQS